MTNKVGPKGQVVIEKQIRDQLGIGPGWSALQRLEDGHVIIDFIPPEHNRSAFGVLAPYIKRHITSDEDWRASRETAWAEMAREKESHPLWKPKTASRPRKAKAGT